jgi:hypothetical protein
MGVFSDGHEAVGVRQARQARHKGEGECGDVIARVRVLARARACRALQQGRLWEEIKCVESGRGLEAEAVPWLRFKRA